MKTAAEPIRLSETGNFHPVDPAQLERLWQQSGAAEWDLSLDEFTAALMRIGASHHFGQPKESIPSSAQRIAFLESLKLADLALAQACAKGREHAWERFLVLFHQPLVRAAIAITGSESMGRDLADALYAELYGLKMRDGVRRCPLESYHGRGSLLGWLRTTLAQRHVDHHRRNFREQPLDETVPDPSAPERTPHPATAELALVGSAVRKALERRSPEDRFLLASYYLDGRTLLQIAQTVRVHEATMSRRIHRLTGELNKQVRKNLQDAGLSKRAAQEALETDPRDLDLNLKKLLQFSQLRPFPEKAGK